MVSRSEAERELNRLLKRALRSVPFVRLDKVEEVTEKFKLACTLLEDHLDDNFDLNTEEDDGADETGISSIPRSVPVDVTRPASDSEEEDEDEEREEKERQEKEQKELEDKEREARIRPKAGEAVRKDFSSPDIRSRGLKVPAPSGGEEPRKAVGASSRAGLSSRAKQPSEGGEASNPRIGLKGASSRAKDGANDLRKILIKSKKPPAGDVPASKDRFTKDEGTPRLTGRSLVMKAAAEGGRSKSTSDLFRGEEDNTAVLARDATSDSNTSGDSSGPSLVATYPPKKPSSRAAGTRLPTGFETSKSEEDLYREDDNNEDTLPSSSTSGSNKKISLQSLPSDLIGKSSSSKAISRITDQALETPHSPLQLNAHRTLLKIAGSQGSSIGVSHTISSGGHDLGEIIPIQQKVETPKPAFLRRLDSPKTNHGILISHKTRLNKMLRRARRGVPHIKLDQYEQIKRAFLEAVELLENSTTMALAKKDNLATADPLSKVLLG